MARVDTLGNFLTDVADAIRTKTGDSSLIQASNFDTAIENIPSGGGADLSEYFETNITTTGDITDGPVQFIKKIPPITITGTQTKLDYSFSFIKQKTGIKLIYNGNTVTSIVYLFGGSNYTSIDVSEFDTSQISSMSQCFYECKYLTSLDLSTWDTTKVKNVSNMFGRCTALTQIDMRNATFGSMTSSAYSNMFGSNATAGVPDDCLIIVKDNTAKTWITSKFSRLTNVKTVAELSEE